MNILQLVPKLDLGGVEKGTVEVARYLTLRGHKAVVVSGGGKLEKALDAMGARHYILPVGRKNPFVMVYCYHKLKHIIKKENIDIVHARSRVPALTAYFAARATHRHFITTAHGQYKKHLMSRVMGWGKMVIVANEMMARYMRDNFGVPLTRMMIVPRGVDLKKFGYIPPEERKGNKFRIGMISRFTPLKGHLDFLKAASYVYRRMPNLEIMLMGEKSSAKEEYIKRIELSIRHLMLGKIVEFVDSDKDVADVLKELDVLVSANREQEAFGRAIIEAQARGVPVVATRVGGVVENVEDGVTGLLCEPSDPSDMAEKIMRYAKEPALVKNITQKARENVDKKYSLDEVMKHTLDTYSQVLEKKNILIFKMSSLGDIILSVPSLRAMRKRHPNAAIKVLVDVRFREVLDKCPYIDEVITYDPHNRDKGIGFLKLAGRLRAEHFDISVDLQNNRSSHLLAFLSMIPERYGYHNKKLSFLLNRKIGLPEGSINPVKHQSRVLGLMGITRLDEHLELWPEKENDIWAENFLKENWLKQDQKLVALSLSASKKWKTKNWSIQSMAELSEIMAKEKSIRVVLIGLENEAEEAKEFIRRTTAKPINAIGKTSVSKLISLIKRCDALVSGDSSPMHIASAVGTPFVALFGPTDPGRHAPPAENSRVIFRKISCSPCYKASCFKKRKCMNLITPREVFDAVIEVMK